MALAVFGIPHGGKVNPEFYRHLQVVQNNTLQHQFAYLEIELMIVGKARSVIVEDFLNSPQGDVLWFVDDDVLPPAHAGVLIDQALQYGIVSGVYYNRHSPYTPQFYKLSALPEEEGMYEPIIDYPDTGMVHSDAAGFGCMAIRRDVLVKMKELHEQRMGEAFEVLARVLEKSGRARQQLEYIARYARNMSPWFEFLDLKGEDFYFCERAKAAGFSIWTNVDVKCTHLGTLPVTEGHFLFLRENNLLKRILPDGKVLEDGDSNSSPPGGQALERGDLVSREPGRERIGRSVLSEIAREEGSQSDGSDPRGAGDVRRSELPERPASPLSPPTEDRLPDLVEMAGGSSLGVEHPAEDLLDA